MTQNVINGNGLAVVAFSSGVISGKTVGGTLLTTAAPQNFIPTQLIITLAGVSLLTTPCTIALGSTVGGTDIMAPVLVTGLAILNNVTVTLLSTTKMIAAGTPIYANVTIAALATTFNLRVSLVGINI